MSAYVTEAAKNLISLQTSLEVLNSRLYHPVVSITIPGLLHETYPELSATKKTKEIKDQALHDCH